MPTFAQNFQTGDVVYGISQSRAPYLNSLPALLKTYCEDTGAFLICDSYNNRTFLGVTNMQYGTNLGTNVNTIKNPQSQADLDHNWNYYENDLGSVSMGVEVKERVTAYFDALSASKHSPYKAVNEPPTKWTSKGDLLSTQLAIRRACKFGLEYIIMRQHGTVHFVLDVPNNLGTEMDMGDVVDKAKYNGPVPDPQGQVPITFSELRCCYRNRQAWVGTGRLKFYLSLNEVQPPWDRNPGLWQQYEIARSQKNGTVRTTLMKKMMKLIF
jgi:hypothetical protein